MGSIPIPLSQSSAVPPTLFPEKVIRPSENLSRHNLNYISYPPFRNEQVSILEGKDECLVTNEIASSTIQTNTYESWDPNESYDEMPNITTQNGLQIAECQGSRNFGLTLNDSITFKSYLYPEDMAAYMNDTLPSPHPLYRSQLLHYPYQPRRQHSNLTQVVDPSNMPAYLDPKVTVQPSTQVLELGATEQAHLMEGVILTSTYGILRPPLGNSYSVSMDFDCFFEIPPSSKRTSGHTVTSNLGDISSDIKWSVEEVRYFSQHRNGLGTRQEDCDSSAATYNTSESDVESTTTRWRPKRSRSDEDITMRTTDLSIVEGAGRSDERQNLTKNDFYPKWVNHTSFVHPPGFYKPCRPQRLVPYTTQEHTVESRRQKDVSCHQQKGKQKIRSKNTNDHNYESTNYSHGKLQPARSLPTDFLPPASEQTPFEYQLTHMPLIEDSEQTKLHIWNWIPHPASGDCEEDNSSPLAQIYLPQLQLPLSELYGF